MPTSETARAHRFTRYVNDLASPLGHRDRHEPLRAYITGLCLPGERKSVEPMAARVDPRHVRGRHQSMHHFVADAPWAGMAPWPRGSWTTPGFPRKASTRWVWPGSTAGSWANRTTAKWR